MVIATDGIEASSKFSSSSKPRKGTVEGIFAPATAAFGCSNEASMIAAAIAAPDLLKEFTLLGSPFTTLLKA
jgi:hypothetical protein